MYRRHLALPETGGWPTCRCGPGRRSSRRSWRKGASCATLRPRSRTPTASTHHERQREAKVAAKRAREAHRPTKVVTPRIGIATNDLERKLAQVRSFLDAGAAVRVRVEGQIRPSAGEGLLDEVQSVFAQLARSDRQARAVLLVPRS